MTGVQLQKIKEKNKKSLTSATSEKDSLEKEKLVLKYLKELETIEREQEFQKFLNKLQIGLDGTVFGPHDLSKDNAFKSTHYNLTMVLSNAFFLKSVLTDRNKLDSQLEITFQDLSQYIAQANQILTDMNYFPGDRVVFNEYRLEIYENPMNYSMVNFEMISPYLTEDVLRMSYNLPFLKLREQSFLMDSKTVIQNTNLEQLTPRECEAFYGPEAMVALGLKSIDRKIKIYEKTSK